MSLEEAFQEFQKLPDWDRFPMPEVFYEHFKLKKPQPLGVNEAISYMPPPYQSIGGEKIEVREPAPGGVREIKELQQLPVDVKLRLEDGELKEYPAPDPEAHERALLMQMLMPKDLPSTYTDYFKKITEKTSDDMKQGFGQNLWNLPIKHNTKETQPE